MTGLKYAEAYALLKQRHEDEERKFKKEWAASHNKYAVGDVVRRGGVYLKIISMSPFFFFNEPFMEFQGVRCRKDGSELGKTSVVVFRPWEIDK